MSIRFSAITTIRGKNPKMVQEATTRKWAQLASLPHVAAFQTTIPRTREKLVVFLSDDDAVAFQACREGDSSLRNRLLANMQGKGNARFESAEQGLNQMADEGALQQFLQQHPDLDVSGERHERIDCNRYWFKPGTFLGTVLENIRSSVSFGPYVPRGQFDFWQDLKNPIHACIAPNGDD